MGLTERSKKKVQLYKKAIVHFLLCFVMGFFTGFAPTGKPSFFSSLSLTRSAFSPQPIEIVSGSSNRTLLDETPVAEPTSRSTNNSDDANSEKIQEEYKEVDELVTRRLIIVVTPTSMKDQTRGVNLRRLSNTLRLVPPPLLWVVVEQQCESDQVSEILRKTGIMYRHVVFKENFTDAEVEMDHQRNLALNHIEHHRLSGIVHFAGLSNVYDLSFFDEIRGIEVFGTWPMALVSANRNRVIIEGPVCDSSEVVGWHLRKMNNLTDAKSPVHISSFAFNSSILWDPERWGRPSSVQDTTQGDAFCTPKGRFEPPVAMGNNFIQDVLFVLPKVNLNLLRPLVIIPYRVLLFILPMVNLNLFSAWVVIMFRSCFEVLEFNTLQFKCRKPHIVPLTIM